MNYDKFGQAILTTDDIVQLLYQNPEINLSRFAVSDPDTYNNSIESLHLDLDRLCLYQSPDMTVEEFDRRCQSKWYMPDSYRDMDIAAWVLDQCTEPAELQRAGDELIRFQERNLFPLLCYLKYLVDTMRDNAIIWGVGRGSSVASFVLYKIGVHRINSLYYDLDITEFLKD